MPPSRENSRRRMNRNNGRKPAELLAEVPRGWGDPLPPSNLIHRRQVSDSTSLTTETNPSSNTQSTHSQESVDHDHQICIVEPDSADGQQLSSFNVSLSSVKRYSVVLFNHLMQDRLRQEYPYSSSLSVSNPVELIASVDTLRIFVGHIDRVPRGPAVGGYEDTMFFDQFLELSTILWEYKCSTNPWQRVANRVRNGWAQDRDGQNRQNLVSWVFLSLLYEWPDLFEDASRELISNYSEFQKALDEVAFIPRQLKIALEEGRRRWVQDTFLFIKHKWAKLQDPLKEQDTTLFRLIYRDLINRWKVDVRNPVPPEDLYQSVSPNKLLRQVETTTSEKHSQPASTLLPTPHTDSPSSSLRGEDPRAAQRALNSLSHGPRDDEGIQAFGQLLSAGYNAIRRKRHSALEMETQKKTLELDKICEVLLAECQEFRENNLQRPMRFDDVVELRNKQLIV